jgi:hypothetical protein
MMVNDLSYNNKLKYGTFGTPPRPCGTITRVWGVPFPTFPLERGMQGREGQQK